jgi:hypothetical protein
VLRPDLHPYEREQLARNRREGLNFALGYCVTLILTLILTPILVWLMSASDNPRWVFKLIRYVFKTLS